MFSIVIPSWNNLDCLRLCVDSIRRYSKFDHEILVHLNDGSDGSLEWIKAQGIRYTHTDKNVGICMAVNHLVAQATHDWVLYLNDDMVAAPGWDTALLEATGSAGTDLAMYFGTLVQPKNGGNHVVIERDFGTSPANFDEQGFVEYCLAVDRGDLEGASSQPTLVHKKWWNIVGGYSIEFSPGMSSDDDLMMKFWVAGCRNFRIVGGSRFYHFGCKSTGRIKHNRGGRVFVMKWGVTHLEFHRLYLPSLRKPDGGNSPANPHNFVRGSLLGRIRRLRYTFKKHYPLQDIEAWDAMPGRAKWNEGN